MRNPWDCLENEKRTQAKCQKRKRQRLRAAAGYRYTKKHHIEARWAMFGNKCWMCGKPANGTDHVKPIAKGGSHWPANLRPACRICNSTKIDKWNGVNNSVLTLPETGAQRS